MSVLYLDFETRSVCDLRAAGADVYARDLSTDILCMAYAIDNEEVGLWVPRGYEPPPEKVLSHIEAGKTLCAHNAHFEFAIWSHVARRLYGFPELKIEQLNCTMVRAYAMGLPGALEKAAPAVGLSMEKDMAGNRVMLQLSQPKSFNSDGSPIWYDELEYAEKYLQVYNYCKKDLEIHRELSKRLLDLSAYEKRVYQMDARINQRGIKIDVEAAKFACQIVELEKERLNQEIQDLSDGQISTTAAVGQYVFWLRSQGIEVQSIAKADVIELLDKQDLPQKVRKALLLRQEAAKTSTAKLNAMIKGVSEDQLLRGSTQYGAAGTRRWAGRRVQLQNLAKGNLSPEDLDDIFRALKSGSDPADVRDYIALLYGSALTVLSGALRSFITARTPDRKLLVCDFASIESRVLNWLAGQDDILEIYRGHGKIYEFNASSIFRIPLESIRKDSKERQVGKVVELACGYQGGKGAIHNMSKQFGLKFTDEEADQFKFGWRSSHGKVVRYWWDAQESAMRAITNPGQVYSFGAPGRQISYVVKGSFLFCRLPSGGILSYAYPEIKPVEDSNNRRPVIHYKAVDETKKFNEQRTYGGSLVENITQAVARDLLADAMLRLEEKGFEIVAHIHDEIVIDGKSTDTVKEVEKIMCINPPWAKGLPLSAEGFETYRYRK